MRIKTLKLTNFRNITGADIAVDGAEVVALVGPNGAGKTSVLEALSLLSPGAGLNKAKRDELIRIGAPAWGLHATLLTGADERTVGMAYEKAKKAKRAIKIDADSVDKQQVLASLGSVVWFTPRMDRLFLDAAKPRRDFLDRLVFGLYPNHAENVARYRYHLKSRLRLLKDNMPEDWLILEEEKAAKYAVDILLARSAFVSEILAHMQDVSLDITGSAEKILQEENPAELFMSQLAQNRDRDRQYNETHFGPQRSDLTATLLLEEHEVPLKMASSGQHKRALMNILMANVRLVHEKTGSAPLVLFDELAAHLDRGVRDRLLDELRNLGAQVWLAGTEKTTFEGIDGLCQLNVQNGAILPVE